MKKALIILIFLIFIIGCTKDEPSKPKPPDGPEPNGDWTNYTKENSGLASNLVNAICIDKNGTIWFGTDSGLSGFNGTNWATYTNTGETQTLADNVVNDIAFEDGAYGAELWVATNNGVTVMAVPSVDAVTMATPYRTDNRDLIANKVNAVGVDENAWKWFATDVGVTRFTGSAWQSFTVESKHLADNVITTVASDEAGWKYFGSETGGGVSRLLTEGVDAITSASPYDDMWSGLWSSNIYAIYVDEQGYQWFGTDLGAFFHTSTETKSQWSDRYSTEAGMVADKVQAITKDKNGLVWCGTPEGITIFDGETWFNFTTADGLISNNVLDIAADDDGTVWIATDSGVSHFTGTAAAPQPAQ